MEKPLANKFKPKKIDEIIGQEHLVGKNGIIRRLVEEKKLFSLIFYGPSGVGKTALANAIVNQLKLAYEELNAVVHNKKDFVEVFEKAKLNPGLIVIIDEIHRLNKDKQDLLLPHIEVGTIIMIGLTSANPFHKINPAIRSRCHLFELKPLTEEELELGIDLTIKKLKNIKIDKESKKELIRLANYDLRNAINTLEMAILISNNITIDVIKQLTTKPIYLSDANEDNYYDLLSAFQKSIRGSDVDASLYYLARLLEQDDLDSVLRRLTVIVYEDISLANPTLQTRVILGIIACERVGMPEASIILSNLVIEMALSAKSNSAYLAIKKSLEDVREGLSYPIPKHLKNYSNQYKYPHDYPYHIVSQRYLPNKINNSYYFPQDNKYELNLKETLKKINQIKKDD